LAEGDLVSQVQGEIGKEGKVLVIRRIAVRYHLAVDPEHHDLAARVHEMHAEFCPVARTIRDCVEISTELDYALA
jgi:organic hydroperoxide reductase OsmC/OhrA